MRPILGIDFGQARIGVAISDELRMLAHPVETIPASKEAVNRVAALASEKNVEQIVIGVPRLMSGGLGIAAEEVMRFVETVRKAVSCEVVTWDERLTTVAAHRALRDAGKKTKETRGYVDQVAAQMILQGYLDSLQNAADANSVPQ